MPRFAIEKPKILLETLIGYTEVELKKIEQTNKLNQILPQNQLALELVELNRSIEQNPRDAVAYLEVRGRSSNDRPLTEPY